MTAATRRSLALAALVVAAASAGCRERPANPRVEPLRTPIPESTSRGPRAAEEPPAEHEPGALPAASGAAGRAAGGRRGVPGSIRWTVELEHRITGIDWFPFGGLAISAGPSLQSITSRGVLRWSLVAGEDHRLFRLEGRPVVWSARFGRIFQVSRRGQAGWSRDWAGAITDEPRGDFLLVDAATVATVGADGKDRWRVSLDGLRRLHGPFHCKDGLVFQGMRGLESTVVTISDRGMVLREVDLERGSLLLGAGPGCESLIWRGGEVALLDRRGIERWRRPLPGEPLVRPLDDGFLLISASGDDVIEALVLTVDGRAPWSERLPVSGRLVNIDVLATRDGRPAMLGLCLDVSSPCARPAENRGPYNALLTPGADGRMRVLTRHIQGHLAVAPHPAGGMVVAGSTADDSSEITLRGDDDIVRWQTVLPGRLSAGPFVCPSGEIYAATCAGWDCSPPFRLASITGEAPEQGPAAGAR